MLKDKAAIHEGGRPKGAKNKRNPNEKLQRALANGWDMKDLKELARSMVTDEKEELTSAQKTGILKTLFDVELKLLEMDMKHNKDENQDDSENEDEILEPEDDSPKVSFRLTSG